PRGSSISESWRGASREPRPLPPTPGPTTYGPTGLSAHGYGTEEANASAIGPAHYPSLPEGIRGAGLLSGTREISPQGPEAGSPRSARRFQRRYDVSGARRDGPVASGRCHPPQSGRDAPHHPRTAVRRGRVLRPPRGDVDPGHGAARASRRGVPTGHRIHGIRHLRLLGTRATRGLRVPEVVRRRPPAGRLCRRREELGPVRREGHLGIAVRPVGDPDLGRPRSVEVNPRRGVPSSRTNA